MNNVYVFYMAQINCHTMNIILSHPLSQETIKDYSLPTKKTMQYLVGTITYDYGDPTKASEALYPSCRMLHTVIEY